MKTVKIEKKLFSCRHYKSDGLGYIVELVISDPTTSIGIRATLSESKTILDILEQEIEDAEKKENLLLLEK